MIELSRFTRLRPFSSLPSSPAAFPGPFRRRLLGHRGCRLGIVYPEITEMQARAIFEAAVQLAKKGKKVIPELMIPEFAHPIWPTLIA